MLTDPSSIAWAFNIRGGTARAPGARLRHPAARRRHQLFMDRRKFARAVAAICGSAIRTSPRNSESAIVALAKERKAGSSTRCLQPTSCALWWKTMAAPYSHCGQPASPHCVKEPGEISPRETGRAAHRRDGAAVNQAVVLARPSAARHAQIAVVGKAGRGSPPDRRRDPDAAACRNISCRRTGLVRQSWSSSPRRPTAACGQTVPARFRCAISGLTTDITAPVGANPVRSAPPWC